jgi:hypothetical protein
MGWIYDGDRVALRKSHSFQKIILLSLFNLPLFTDWNTTGRWCAVSPAVVPELFVRPWVRPDRSQWLSLFWGHLHGCTGQWRHELSLLPPHISFTPLSPRAMFWDCASRQGDPEDAGWLVEQGLWVSAWVACCCRTSGNPRFSLGPTWKQAATKHFQDAELAGRMCRGLKDGSFGFSQE